MSVIGSFIRRNPALSYFVLASLLAWMFSPVLRVSPAMAVPALLAPAAAAVMVTSVIGGRQAVGALRGKVGMWRVGIAWYLAALLLPVVLTLLVSLTARLVHPDPGLALSPIGPLVALVFVLVVGEELGWRGFAQPELEKRFAPLIAALMLGVFWGLWHLPNFFIPTLPHTTIPFPAFIIWTISLSVLAAWLLKHTRGSVLIATLFHGSANTFGFLTPNLDTVTRWWLMAAVYAVAAILVVLLFTPKLHRRP